MLNQAASTATGIRSGYDPTQVALRRPGMSAAWGQFRGADPAIGTTGQGIASQALGAANQQQGIYGSALGQFQSNPMYTFTQNMAGSAGSFLGNPVKGVMG